MRIILGLYKNSLYLLNDFPFLIKFPFGLEIHSDPMKIIREGINKAAKIVFCLDGLTFPINYKIFTYMELCTIIENPKYLKKTQFFLDGNPMKRERVVEQFRAKNEGVFENTRPTVKPHSIEPTSDRQAMTAKKQRSRRQRSSNKKGKLVSMFPDE